MIGNIVASTGISILIESVFKGYIALIVSSVLISVISEIIPQSFMSRYAIATAAHLSWFMYFAMGVFFIVAYPIATILDKVLGEEVGMSMSKGMMKKFFHMQREQGELTQDEKYILTAALELNRKEVKEVMTPINDVYMLVVNTIIDRHMMKEIYTKGYSRIPIYKENKQNIIGVLMTKDLILYNANKEKMDLKQLSTTMRDVTKVTKDMNLSQVFGMF